MELWQVVDYSNYHVIARGFVTRREAIEWALQNDYGQFMDGYGVLSYWSDDFDRT